MISRPMTLVIEKLFKWIHPFYKKSLATKNGRPRGSRRSPGRPIRAGTCVSSRRFGGRGYLPGIIIPQIVSHVKHFLPYQKQDEQTGANYGAGNIIPRNRIIKRRLKAELTLSAERGERSFPQAGCWQTHVTATYAVSQSKASACTYQRRGGSPLQAGMPSSRRNIPTAQPK